MTIGSRMTTQSKLTTRLKAARKAAGFKTAKAFVEKHKIPPSTYSQYENGRRIPDEKTLEKYSKLFNVNFDWLKTGNGAPFPSQKNFTKQSEVLANELFNIHEANISLNKDLLHEILKRVLNLVKESKKELPADTIANIVSDIYTDIMMLEKSPETQLKMVETSISVLKRYGTL